MRRPHSSSSQHCKQFGVRSISESKSNVMLIHDYITVYKFVQLSYMFYLHKIQIQHDGIYINVTSLINMANFKFNRHKHFVTNIFLIRSNDASICPQGIL